MRKLQIVTLLLVFFVLLIYSSPTKADTQQTFTSYGDFSMYDETHAGPNEVYARVGRFLRKLDVYSNIIWEYEANASPFIYTTFHEEEIVGLTTTGKIIFLNTSTGIVTKSIETGKKFSEIYFLHIYDDNTILLIADHLWTFDQNGEILRNFEHFSGAVQHVTEDNVYFNFGYVFEKNEGSILIHAKVAEYIDIQKNLGYFTEKSSNLVTLYAVRLSDHVTLWKKDFTNGGYHLTTLQDKDGYIYLLNANALLKIHPQTRKIVFHKSLSYNTARQIRIASNNTLQLIDSSEIVSYDLSGKQLSTVKTPNNAVNRIFQRSDGSFYYINGLYYSTAEPTQPEEENTILESLSVNEKTITLAVDGKQPLKVTAAYDNESTKDVTKNISWTFSKPNIVKFENGTFTGLATGKVIATGTFDGLTITVTISVKDETASVPPATTAIEFSQKHVFSELLADTTAFNKVLSAYTPDELQVIVPAKHFYKTTTTHVPNVLTNISVETSRSVRKVNVVVDGETYTARRISTTTFDASIAGLYQGAEVIIHGFDATDKEIEKQVIRLRDGEFSVQDETAAALSGNYSLRSLMTDSTMFNEILTNFALEELMIGIPKRYIENPEKDIQITFNPLTTKVTVKVVGTIGKIMIISSNNTSYEAANTGNNIFSRDIAGLQYDEMITIRVLNTNGDVVQQETTFVE